MSDTSADKKPEDEPAEKEWTLGDGSDRALDVGSQWFCVWLLVFVCQLCCYIKWGLIEIIGRGFIACAWLLFLWACVHVRYQPKHQKQCPRCQYHL